MNVLIRTAGERLRACPPYVRWFASGIEISLSLGSCRWINLANDPTTARRFNTWLLGAFGAAAIILTALGPYSLLACLVLRRHDMAVRLAICGTPSHMIGRIVRHVTLRSRSGSRWKVG